MATGFSLHDLRFFKFLSEGFFDPVPAAPFRPEPADWPEDRITAAWLGHSTVLMNLFGVWVLTDPVLGSRIGLQIGPIVLGPKRKIRPALGVRDLPPLDLVLLSHAHMDHLDHWSLRRLRGNPTVVTARSTSDLLFGMPFKDVVELDWGDSMELQTGKGPIRIEALEVRHWGARMRHDTHRGFNAYLIDRLSRRICVGGDTAYTESFSRLGQEGGVDLMIVPIGAYNPWIASHCTPEQAVSMARQAGARKIMPVHHQTFKLSVEPAGEPIARFQTALAERPEAIALTAIGETHQQF